MFCTDQSILSCLGSIRDYTSFLSSPFSKVIVVIVSHFSHLAPKSDIFQKECGVRKFGSPHFLHEYTTIEVIFRKYFMNNGNTGDVYIQLLHSIV
jgi:hypothetical protein